ncbi:MAG: ubiquinone biosynthesis protein COQ7 [Gammaproteobacteria bacterium]|nr:ubiquinone biosynthesis protein COQ7 [Gammaproteobacteria bacterium]
MVGVPGSSPGVSTILELSYKTNYRYYSLMNKLLESFLRSDHAGEVGAVYIYKGILSIAKDPDLVEFSTRHLETEKEHLRKIEEILPSSKRSKLVGIWKIAGYLLGFLPSLFGPRIVFATIEAVESFVEDHYEEQLKYLRAQDNPDHVLINLLQSCQDDEIEHKNESAIKKKFTPGILLNLWMKIVGWGSSSAVKVAKII